MIIEPLHKNSSRYLTQLFFNGLQLAINIIFVLYMLTYMYIVNMIQFVAEMHNA